MGKFFLVVAVLVIGWAIFVPGSQTPPAPTATTPAAVKGAPAARNDRKLTPPWPPRLEQSVAVSGDLFAKNYYVVLDGSGSMSERACSGNLSKMQAAKAALAAFAQALPADANLGLQVFDDRGVRERLPLGTGNRDDFIRVVNQARASGGTPLRDSISNAYVKLTQQGAKQLGYGEYHLVIVTDGEANAGQEPGQVVDALLRDSPVVLHTIGFCIGTDHSLNQAGRVIYKAADNPEQLSQSLTEVLAEAPQFSVVKFK